jgi:hypothetical protein
MFFGSPPQQTPTGCIAKAQNPAARQSAGHVQELGAGALWEVMALCPWLPPIFTDGPRIPPRRPICNRKKRPQQENHPPPQKRLLVAPSANGGHSGPDPPHSPRTADQPDALVRRHSRLCANPRRRAQPLHPEAANARRASKTAIPGVHWMRATPIDSVLGLVRFSNAGNRA